MSEQDETELLLAIFRKIGPKKVFQQRNLAIENLTETSVENTTGRLLGGKLTIRVDFNGKQISEYALKNDPRN